MCTHIMKTKDNAYGDETMYKLVGQEIGRYKLAEGDGMEQVEIQITPWPGHLFAGMKNE